MLCSLYKWWISQAMDSGKRLSPRVQRHILSCPSCRSHAELCQALPEEGIRDARKLLELSDRTLPERILSTFSIRGREQERSEPRSTRVWKPKFVAVAAVSLLAAAVTLSLVFLASQRSQQPPSLFRVSGFFGQTAPENVLPRIESPLEQEYVELKKTLGSTADFLLSRLKFDIGQDTE